MPISNKICFFVVFLDWDVIRPFIYQWNVLLDETQEEIQVGSIRKSTISDKVQSTPKINIRISSRHGIFAQCNY